jgi:bifunctional polynucleotide phosphatase/kinase
MKWADTRYVYGETEKFIYKEKMALFDLDGTLIKTISGATFYKNLNDWTWAYDSVKTILNKLDRAGYCIIIITNQGGMTTELKLNVWRERIVQIEKELDVQFAIYCSISNRVFRKPSPMLFDIIKSKYTVDMKSSFFCGDACGRENDFSDTDYKFALNCGLDFATPERVFTGDKTQKPTYKYPELKFKKDFMVNIKKIMSDRATEPEMIILVGMPGSGKSFIAKLFKSHANYVIINRDTMKTKCVEMTHNALKDRQSVIIDNTNPDKESRKEYLNIGKKYGYKCRCIIVDTTIDIAMHNNHYRHYITYDYKMPALSVPDIVYRIYNKKYVKPELSEGFDKIYNIEPDAPLDKKYFLFYY